MPGLQFHRVQDVLHHDVDEGLRVHRHHRRVLLQPLARCEVRLALRRVVLDVAIGVLDGVRAVRVLRLDELQVDDGTARTVGVIERDVADPDFVAVVRRRLAARQLVQRLGRTTPLVRARNHLRRDLGDRRLDALAHPVAECFRVGGVQTVLLPTTDDAFHVRQDALADAQLATAARPLRQRRVPGEHTVRLDQVDGTRPCAGLVERRLLVRQRADVVQVVQLLDEVRQRAFVLDLVAGALLRLVLLGNPVARRVQCPGTRLDPGTDDGDGLVYLPGHVPVRRLLVGRQLRVGLRAHVTRDRALDPLDDVVEPGVRVDDEMPVHHVPLSGVRTAAGQFVDARHFTRERLRQLDPVLVLGVLLRGDRTATLAHHDVVAVLVPDPLDGVEFGLVPRGDDALAVVLVVQVHAPVGLLVRARVADVIPLAGRSDDALERLGEVLVRLGVGQCAALRRSARCVGRDDGCGCRRRSDRSRLLQVEVLGLHRAVREHDDERLLLLARLPDRVPRAATTFLRHGRRRGDDGLAPVDDVHVASERVLPLAADRRTAVVALEVVGEV